MNSFTRRHFLKLTSRGVGLAIVSSGLAGCLGSDELTLPEAPNIPPTPVEFQHGVASGDPTQQAVILWTRVTPLEQNFSGQVNIQWEVATDSGFSDIVTNGSAAVTAASDYTLKIDAVDLTPNTTYYYRFMANGVSSPIGMTKTLPEGNVESVKLAVVSCSNYPAGYFNVYDLASQQSDLDAVLHLGDYIYEYDRDGYASENAATIGREVLPNKELMTLSDYRTRYAQYRSDTSLQGLHAALPFIAIWDDHEVANDAWQDGAENHQFEEGDYEQRKLDALQAYFEWMPIRPVVEGNNEVINRQFSFGNLVDLYMLDTRIAGRDQQLDYGNYLNPITGSLDAAGFTADVSDPNRTLLGAEQLQWLQGSMSMSNATWQVLGQQVLMGRMSLPAAIATQQLSISEFAELAQLAILAQRAQAGDPTLTPEELAYLQANIGRLTPNVMALLQLPAIPYNLDAWDGYAYEREVVLGTAKQLNKNLVVLAGDTHNAWAINLKDASGDLVGVEFATPSVSSPGLEEYLSIAPEDALATEAGIVQLVEDLQYVNVNNRGFMTLTFTADKVESEWHFVDTILSTSYVEDTARGQRAESSAANPGVRLV
ncbi:alkaline phosphatase D family protein [Aestuariibacter salexigens]|uniref:alkaline phosphatase D family protein n=1 Tax=Aestuariibacter salexigens TaxID=226010 RepID=UPI0004005889|nr:alkaline phosphatase D family protein [Aestuariibacter salexigens]